MSNVITLNAEAAYHQTGHFIALITGRHPKYTFEREFRGSKEGKRGEYIRYTTDIPGLYETRDIDSKGRKSTTFYVVWQDEGNLKKRSISLEDAMLVAKSNKPINQWGMEFTIRFHESRLEDYENMKLDGIIALPARLGKLEPGEVSVADAKAEREVEIERLRRLLSAQGAQP